MEHRKEWFTCDRCGVEMKEMPRKKIIFHRKLMSPAEVTMKYGKTYGYVANTELVSPEIMAVEIHEVCDIEHKNFHLRPRCRKEFERWMKNEHGSSN